MDQILEKDSARVEGWERRRSRWEGGDKTSGGTNVHARRSDGYLGLLFGGDHENKQWIERRIANRKVPRLERGEGKEVNEETLGSEECRV